MSHAGVGGGEGSSDLIEVLCELGYTTNLSKTQSRLVK